MVLLFQKSIKLTPLCEYYAQDDVSYILIKKVE